MGALSDIAKTAWQMPQTAAGLVQGMYRTGGLPSGVTTGGPDGPEFRFAQEGAEPSTMGQTIIYDPKAATPEQMSHERVHTEQSDRFGPLWMLANSVNQLRGKLGSARDSYLGNPFEEEAYLRTSSPETLGQYQSDRYAAAAKGGDKGAKEFLAQSAERKRAASAERTRKLREEGKAKELSSNKGLGKLTGVK